MLLLTVLALAAPLLYARSRRRRAGGGVSAVLPPMRPPVQRLARPRRLRLGPGRIGLYAFLLSMALFFLAPLYVMLVTSLKSMDEIRQGHLLALPLQADLSAWRTAWSQACTGVSCEGVRVGFWNSVAIVVPSTLLPIGVGALNGYALSLWRPRGAPWLFGVLMLGAFIPVQVMIYPLVQDPGCHRAVRLAAGHRAGAPGVQHAGDDAAVPQLLRRGCRSSCSRPRGWTAAASGASSCS